MFLFLDCEESDEWVVTGLELGLVFASRAIAGCWLTLLNHVILVTYFC